VLEPATQYNQRSNQFDLRFTRRFQVRGARLQANFDIYNLLNANFVSTRNGTYGTNGALWLQPGAILPARLLKFSGLLNFCRSIAARARTTFNSCGSAPASYLSYGMPMPFSG
jgi:hypothetical protein